MDAPVKFEELSDDQQFILYLLCTDFDQRLHHFAELQFSLYDADGEIVAKGPGVVGEPV